MQPRTRRQREILDFINDYTERKGYQPSYQLIARHLGIASKSAVAKHVEALERLGILQRRREDGSFGLEIRPPSAVLQAVCEIGWLEISAKADEGFREDWELNPIFVPRFLLGYLEPERARLFRVPNNAMLGDHICAGDIALIEKRSFARDGSIVAADIGSRAALKRYYRAGATVELRPSNEKYETIRLAADKVEVLGLFRGLIRPLL
jgi:repressor LexA